MLTLQELKKISDIPGCEAKIPTAKQLRESKMAIVQERLGLDSKISVYQNGYVVYQVGKHSTVFPLHSCRDYFYMADRKAVCLSEQFFGNKVWYLRLVLEGEDRLNRNHEEKERNWNISYSAISEDWFAMENLTESVLEQLEKQETVAEILQDLSERQKYIIQKYYLQEETQEQISNELGISQQAVSATISHAIRMIRNNYSAFLSPSGNRICYGEGRL
ncbi:sigma-70 family RNA polymerase sigma factor [bacterium D16-50]|nr:sigma-70 family RNA polymerase sigma factor [bacterium D16-50]